MLSADGILGAGLRGPRGLPGRHHDLRRAVPLALLVGQRLLHRRPQHVVVGDQPVDRRHRDQHADAHRGAGDRVCHLRAPGAGRQPDLPAGGRRLHRRASADRMAVHTGLLPGQVADGLRAAAAAIRNTSEALHGRAVPADAAAGGRRACIRGVAGSDRRHLRTARRRASPVGLVHRHSRRADADLHIRRRHCRRHLD